ncbi:MAG: hypothetical protein LBQ30_04355, partial [Treponema sp.]|nr:hypothetical protein [Treponema sp.]
GTGRFTGNKEREQRHLPRDRECKVSFWGSEEQCFECTEREQAYCRISGILPAVGRKSMSVQEDSGIGIEKKEPGIILPEADDIVISIRVNVRIIIPLRLY